MGEDLVTNASIENNKDNNKPMVDAANRAVEGLNKADESLETLGKSILEKLDQILVGQDNFTTSSQKDSFKEDVKGSLSQISSAIAAIAGISTENEKEETSEAGKKAPTNKASINDLGKLTEIQGLGFNLIYWKLDDICSLIESKGSNSDDSKKKGGFGEIFSNLLKGAAGMGLLAIALAAFAGSIFLFSKIDWPPAIAGLLSFGIFTGAMLGMANRYAKAIPQLALFAAASVALSFALVAFSASLMITSFIWESKGGLIEITDDKGKLVKAVQLPAIKFKNSLKGLGTFAGFIFAMVGISKLTKDHMKDFKDFGIGALAISVALGTFAMSMALVSMVFSDGYSFVLKNRVISIPKLEWGAILKGLGSFGLFAAEVAGLSHIVNKDSKSLVKFGMSAIAMSAALAAFSLSMVLVGTLFSEGFKVPTNTATSALGIAGATIKADAMGSLKGIGIFTTFVIAVGGLAFATSKIKAKIVAFAGTAALIAISLTAIAIPIAISATIAAGGGGEFGPFKISEKVSASDAFIGLGIMSSFVGAFGLIAAGLGFIAAPVALGTLVLLGISASIVAIGLSLSTVMNIMKGGKGIDENGKEIQFTAVTEADIEKFTSLVNTLISGIAGINWIKAGAAKGSAKLIQPVTEVMINVADCLIKTKDTLSYLGFTAELGGKSDDFTYGINEMFNTLDLVISKTSKIDWKTAKAASKNAEKLLPVTELSYKIAETLIKVSQASKEVDKEHNSKNLELFERFTTLIIALADASANMGKLSSKAIKNMSEAYGPIVNSIDKMVDVVQKVADLNSKNGKDKDLIKNAVLGLKEIVGDKNFGFISTFNKVTDDISNVGKKQKTAIESISVLADSILSITDCIQKAAEVSPEKLIVANTNLIDIDGFMKNMINCFKGNLFTNTITKNVKKVYDLVSGVGDFKEKGLINISDSLKNLSSKANEIGLDKSSALFENTVNGIGLFANINSKAFENITATKKSLDGLGSKNMIKALDSVSSTLEKLKAILDRNPFDRFNTFLSLSTNSVRSFNTELSKTISHLKNISKEAKNINKLEIKSPAIRNTSYVSSGYTADKVNSNGNNNVNNKIYEVLSKWDDEGIPSRPTEAPRGSLLTFK